MKIDMLKYYFLSKISQPIPHSAVVPQSVPIVFFGNIGADTATISLNPSNRQFEKVKGKKRVVDRADLGVRDNQRLNIEQAEIVYDSFISYFDNNPYTRWFGPIGKIFEGTEYSYYSGSMTHINISPWATVAKWNELEQGQKNAVLDVDIVDKVIRHKRRLYINGRTTAQKLIDCGVDIQEYSRQVGGKSVQIFCGKWYNCDIIGWDLYWQYSYLTVSQRQAFVELIFA